MRILISIQPECFKVQARPMVCCTYRSAKVNRLEALCLTYLTAIEKELEQLKDWRGRATAAKHSADRLIVELNYIGTSNVRMGT